MPARFPSLFAALATALAAALPAAADCPCVGFDHRALYVKHHGSFYASHPGRGYVRHHGSFYISQPGPNGGHKPAYIRESHHGLFHMPGATYWGSWAAPSPWAYNSITPYPFHYHGFYGSSYGPMPGDCRN